MNRCRPEKKDMKEYGRMRNIFLKLEKGEVLDRNARGWNLEGEKEKGCRDRGQEVEG